MVDNSSLTTLLNLSFPDRNHQIFSWLPKTVTPTLILPSFCRQWRHPRTVQLEGTAQRQAWVSPRGICQSWTAHTRVHFLCTHSHEKGLDYNSRVGIPTLVLEYIFLCSYSYSWKSTRRQLYSWSTFLYTHTRWKVHASDALFTLCVIYIQLNPLGTVDGYSRSLRDATGPVDGYSRIPTSTQATCITA